MIYVMLPAYNEEQGIQAVLKEIARIACSHEERFRIVVVDDGSQDRTSQIAGTFSDRLDMKLFKFEKNRGVGDVFKTGLQFIVSDSTHPVEDICIVLDSDNTQDPKTMIDMIHQVKQGSDIVIASRFRSQKGMIGCPLPRRIISGCVSWLFQLMIRLPHVKDYSTFYRAYRVSLLKEGIRRYGDYLLAGKGFAAVGGLLLKLANLTSNIAEVPSVLRYDLKVGRSGMKIWKTTQGYLGLIYDYYRFDKFRKMEQTSESQVRLKA